jgi:hypothetical protein
MPSSKPVDVDGSSPLRSGVPAARAPKGDVRPATGQDVRSPRERAERRLWRLWKPLRHGLAGSQPGLTVFVAGMQRSGTNMLMETLEWSAHTDIYHETDARAFDNYEMRPRAVIRQLIGRSRAPVFVVKSLCELDQIGSLMDEFTPAKTVWIVRAFDDSVNSAVRSFGHFAHQVHRLAKNKAAAGWRGRGMSDETQTLLRGFDHPALTDASAAALMWYYRNVLLFEQGLDRDPRVKVLRYENLVRDPQAELRSVFDFLGLGDWSPWISRYIHPKSVGKSPLADIEPGIRAVCEGLLARFDALSAAQVPTPAAPAARP